MISVKLSSSRGKTLWSRDFFGDVAPAAVGADALVVVPVTAIHGTFKSVTRISAGTTVLTSPNADGSLLVTDLLIGGEKQASSTVEIRFTDDVEDVALFIAHQPDAPPNIAHSFVGRFQGWKNARIDVITSGAGDATVTVGYTKIPTGLPFAEWDALR